MLEIQRKQIGPDISVVHLAGRLTMGRPCQELEGLVDDLIRENVRKLILDLSQVHRVDSTGIGAIVVSSTKVKKAGGELRAVGATGMVHDMVYTANIQRIVGFYPTLDDAVAAFAAPAAGAS